MGRRTDGLSALWVIACLCVGAGLAPMMGSVANAAVSGVPNALDESPSGAPIIDFNAQRAPRAAAPEPQPVGNPLWAIPLSSLNATRERPIFAPSRRPAAPVVAGPPPARSEAPSSPPVERPKLTLIGAVVGESGAVAIFLDPAMEAIRLHMGEGYGGWILNSVKGREAVLQKDDESWVFILPAASADSGPGIPVVPDAASPSQLRGADSSVPFIPRHTPKNGEPDGL